MDENYNNNLHYVYKVINIFNNVTEFSIALPQIIFSEDIFSLFSECCLGAPLTFKETIFSHFALCFFLLQVVGIREI